MEYNFKNYDVWNLFSWRQKVSLLKILMGQLKNYQSKILSPWSGLSTLKFC